MRDRHGRKVDGTPDEIFGQVFLAGLWQQDPELARLCEPGPEADREPRPEDEAAAELVEQIRKEING